MPLTRLLVALPVGLLVLATMLLGRGGSRPEPVAAAPAAETADLTAAAEEPAAANNARKVVVLDPGHGGAEVGAAANGVTEKHSNLDMALRVEALLAGQGFDVFLTRRSDARVSEEVPGFSVSRSDLQARVDLANAAGASVFVSIHSNGSTDTSQNGVEAWWDSKRDLADASWLLATMIKDGVLAELHAWGYAARDRGLFDGSCFRFREGRCTTLFVTGGPRSISRADVLRRGGDPEALGFNGADTAYTRPTNMPAVLVELLIISNQSDAAVLRSEGGRDAMARGVAAGIASFLGGP